MKPTPLRSLAPVLRVTDLSRSLAFYRGLLDFELEFNFQDFYVGLIRDQCRLHLKLSSLGGPATPSVADSDHIVVWIGVADAAEEAARLAAAQVPFAVPLRQMEYGKEFYVRDPDGNVLALVQ